MAKRKLKLKKTDFKKFIIESPYGTTGAYPPGEGATIVLSTVTIEFKKHLNSPPYHDIHTNTKDKHAERGFLDDLRQKIDELPADSNINKIEVNLVQNYSPCNVPDHERAYCANEILKFKNDMEGKRISVSLTIKFANFYKHKEKCNYEGLQKLVENNVTLVVFHEKEWEALLNNKDFVDLTNDDNAKLLERATSKERKEREEHDEKILTDITGKAKDNKLRLA